MTKRLVILGAGESGVGTAILALKKGYDVFVSDKGDIAQKYRTVLQKYNVNFEENTHTESKILNADLVMKSPGIPDKIPIVTQLKKRGISVISEIEFAYRFTDATLIAITGSNGKTTTATLLYHILKRANFDVGIAGNIGDSFALQVAEKSHRYYVLELSSFQLDGIQKFAAHIAVITNISPDHLDRYDYDFQKYIASKFGIVKNQKESDFLIYDAEDLTINTYLKNNNIKPRLLPFSTEKKFSYGTFLQGDDIHIQLKTKTIMITKDKLRIRGKHNLKNAMATTAAASLLEVKRQQIQESLLDFEGVEHRLENVKKVDGVQFVNDSKATNVNATFYALECMEQPTVWIVGGQDKGNDYTELMPLVREKVKAIVCLGLNNDKIIETFGNVVDSLVETTTAEQAVKVSKSIAQKGDTVLLSPACASYDIFENYQDRGHRFKQAVANL